MAFCLSLVLIIAAVAQNVEASNCTWLADTTSNQAIGALDLYGDPSPSYFFVGNLSIQPGPVIGLALASLSTLPAPPVCPNITDEATVSLRFSTAGLQVPSVLYSGSLYSTYLTVDLATDTGTVDLPFTNAIAPLTMQDAQKGAASSAWNIYSAMTFNAIAGLARESFLFQNTQPISCNYGGTGTATYDPVSNSSVVSVTGCSVVPWAFCTGSMVVSENAPLPLVGPTSVIVASPAMDCVGTFSDYTSQITFVDSATIITPGFQGLEYILSSTFFGSVNFPTLTVPVYSNVQNLSIESIENGGELTLFNISGTGFKQCFGKWYAYDPSSVVIIGVDGTTTGTVNVVMPEITDTVQTILQVDGSVLVTSNLSGSPATTPYPDTEALYANCAF